MSERTPGLSCTTNLIYAKNLGWITVLIGKDYKIEDKVAYVDHVFPNVETALIILAKKKNLLKPKVLKRTPKTNKSRKVPPNVYRKNKLNKKGGASSTRISSSRKKYSNKNLKNKQAPKKRQKSKPKNKLDLKI